MRLYTAPLLRPFSMAAALAALLSGRHVRADEPLLPKASPETGGHESPGRFTVEPPRLVQAVEAEYPEPARLSAIEADVLLIVSIDAEGNVIDAQIAESAGNGFDEAARNAVLKFRFAPALRGGRAVAARIRYRYEFRLPAPATEARNESAPEARLPPSKADSQQKQQASGTEQQVELVVRGEDQTERLRQSAEAVRVVDLERAKLETADLGEVLARTEGIGIRRQGGLGSYARLELNGLGSDYVPVFLDGIPIEFTGYHLGGVANVPVNLLERVERYAGVLPVRFGSDALVGALNLVTEEVKSGSAGSASYQVGSWATHRRTIGAHHVDANTGFLARINGFSDYAENDYPIDVEVPDAAGRPQPATVYRFHDAYRAEGAGIDLGVLKRPFADRLVLRLFVTDYGKQLQHNNVMSVPYGEVEYGARVYGANLRYEQPLLPKTRFELVAAYANSATDFKDNGTWVYDWFGRRIRERRVPGEISSNATDQTIWQDSFYSRAYFKWLVAPNHSLRISTAPTYETRAGVDRTVAPDSRDPLTAERQVLRLVSGAEYEADLFDDRLENVLFIKDYVYMVRSEEPLPSGTFRDRNADRHRLGVGAGVRYRFVDFAYAKASYEHATRLPRPEELFGDAVLVVDNLTLVPEVSHNANVGITLTLKDTPVGALRTEAAGFMRNQNDLIVLLGNDRVFSYHNVYAARTLGIEASSDWISPGEYLALDGNFTVQDSRNTSSKGTFGEFEGDRIPNRPYLFANGGARLQFREVSARNDQLTLAWHSRYVKGYLRSWESVGLLESKQKIPSQFLHSLALTYVLRGKPFTVSSTIEVENISNAKAFDVYGIQRPGRSFYFKGAMTVEP